MKSEILPPLTARVHIKQTGWRFGIRLWLPLFLLWLLLLPLAVLLLPFLFAASLIVGFRFRFRKTLGAIAALLAGLRGTDVKVENSATRVFVKLN